MDLYIDKIFLDDQDFSRFLQNAEVLFPWPSSDLSFYLEALILNIKSSSELSKKALILCGHLLIMEDSRRPNIYQ